MNSERISLKDISIDKKNTKSDIRTLKVHTPQVHTLDGLDRLGHNVGDARVIEGKARLQWQCWLCC